MSKEQKQVLLRQAMQFRALGKLCRGETFREKLNGAVAVGLAEVCESLAELIKEERRI